MIIAALDEDGVIGRDGDLPWRLPKDLASFRRLTMGHPILMGRRTHAAIGRALDGRTNIVLTRDPTYQAPGCIIAGSLEAALAAAAASGAEQLFGIGGADIYRLLLPLAQRLVLTHVHARVEGDTHFPPYQTDEWERTAATHHEADARHAHPFTIAIYERR